MSVGYSAEHDELRQVVRDFLRDKSPSQEVRRLMEAGESRDDEVWALLTGQLGLSGIAVPEEYGGSGYGPIELAIVLEEMGRALLVAPYFATVALAGQAIAASGDPAAMGRWLPGIADGSLTAAFAIAEESGSWDLAEVAATAEPTGDGWAVTGTKLFVVDGDTADLLLVVARAPDGPGVFCVERGTAGVERAKLDTLDLTRALGSVVLRGAQASRVGAGRDNVEWLSEVINLALAALAAEQIGGAASASISRSNTRRSASSSAAPSAHSRPSSTSARTCCLRSSPAGQRSTTPARRSPSASRTRRSPRRSLTPTARKPSRTPRKNAFRSTAASATRGSTTPTCTCGGRSRRSCSSARPPGSVPGWPSWPGSEGRS
jgi:alkylation response protein AidB-like acyl-CoA dehydrogenase